MPLELNLLAINRFLGHGYEFIGLDHFAKPTEALAGASRDGTLRRNFQGMTTEKNLEIVALGPSAISQLEGSIAQNLKTSHEWRERVDNSLTTERGMRLSLDDRIRQEVLQQLYSFGRIDTQAVEQTFGIHFDDYFASECERLRIWRIKESSDSARRLK